MWKIRIHATYKIDTKRKCHTCDKCFRNLWRFRSKFSHAVKSLCEFFIHVTNTKWEKYGSTALMRTVKTDVHGDSNNRWHMCYALAHMRAVIKFYWYLAFQLFIEIKSNKVICFEIKCLRLYTAKEVIIQAKSSKRYAGQWILGTWRHSLATRKP